jgi:hypothetical protein
VTTVLSISINKAGDNNGVKHRSNSSVSLKSKKSDPKTLPKRKRLKGYPMVFLCLGGKKAYEYSHGTQANG